MSLSASHVVIRLVKNYPNYKIVNFDKLDYCACIENVESVVGDYPNYKFVKGNLCSADLVNHVMDHEEIDTVMHFAAQTHVGILLAALSPRLASYIFFKAFSST